MVTVDLITGILGAGKTTFLKKYADYFIRKGNRIGILENDFGAVNVDMMLLQDLRGERCELEMVSGGCDRDCHKRRFKTKLISMGMCGYDRVLIEPSGIFDVDEFFDTLREEPLDRWYRIGNVIAIVDAEMEEGLSDSLEFLLASQIANAGTIVLSHVRENTAEKIHDIKRRLNHAMEQVQCKRRFQTEIVGKDWNLLEDTDFEAISTGGYVISDYVKHGVAEDAYSSVYFMNVHVPEEKWHDLAEKLFREKACGKVIRLKGFMKREDGIWMEINAKRGHLEMKPVRDGQEVFIVIGECLDEAEIKRTLEGICD